MKIKVNIPGFGERFCSNNVEYKLYFNRNYYRFYKKGTDILHNEYGPACEWKDKDFTYWINNQQHRLDVYSVSNSAYKLYNVIGKYLGETKEQFIKNLANTLIPRNIKFK